jgi:hypothetical protein
MSNINLDRFMAQDMPKPEDTYDRADAVNGLAPGDRVIITDGELKGAYGKVVYSRYGCMESCRFACYLVSVELMARPPGVDDFPWRMSFLGENVRMFKASEVSHAD